MSDGVILSQKILENPFSKMEKGRGIKLAEFLVEHGVDILYAKKHFEHKGPEYVFSNAEVDARITDLKTLNELMEMKKEFSQ
jgi:predicted Fe-Mo cluster-binding NifX family protein